MCNDGILKIMGDADRKHHDKTIGDSRVSITCVRIGNSAGNNGPVVFIANGKNVNRNFIKKRLIDHYKMPAVSCVVTNDYAYMDDDTWGKVVKVIAPGIGEMPVIKDYPNCKCLMPRSIHLLEDRDANIA